MINLYTPVFLWKICTFSQSSWIPITSKYEMSRLIMISEYSGTCISSNINVLKTQESQVYILFIRLIETIQLYSIDIGDKFSYILYSEQ